MNETLTDLQETQAEKTPLLEVARVFNNSLNRPPFGLSAVEKKYLSLIIKERALRITNNTDAIRNQLSDIRNKLEISTELTAPIILNHIKTHNARKDFGSDNEIAQLLQQAVSEGLVII